MGHANLHVTLSRYAKFIPCEDDGKVLSEVTDHLRTLVSDENVVVDINPKSFTI